MENDSEKPNLDTKDVHLYRADVASRVCYKTEQRKSFRFLKKKKEEEERKKAVCIGVNLQVYIDSNTYNSNLNIMEF